MTFIDVMTVSSDVEQLFTTVKSTYGRIDAMCSMASGNYRHVNNVETIEENFFIHKIFASIASVQD